MNKSLFFYLKSKKKREEPFLPSLLNSYKIYVLYQMADQSFTISIEQVNYRNLYHSVATRFLLH